MKGWINLFKEFKEFAMRGNVMDMAIGIILGGAFGKIVSSFVNDIIMPPIGIILGKVNFSNLFIALNGNHYDTIEAAKAAGAPILNLGTFIQNIVDFLIVAFVIFIVVRQMNRLKKEEAPAPAATKQCPFCKTDIAIEATRCPNCTSHLE